MDIIAATDTADCDTTVSIRTGVARNVAVPIQNEDTGVGSVANTGNVVVRDCPLTRAAHVDWVVSVQVVTIDFKVVDRAVLGVHTVSRRCSRDDVVIVLRIVCVCTEVEPHTEVDTVNELVVAHVESVLAVTTVVGADCVEVVWYEDTSTTVNHRVARNLDVVESRGLDTHVVVVDRTGTHVGRRIVVHQQAVGHFEVTVVLVVTTTSGDTLDSQEFAVVDVVVTVAVGSRVS